MKLQPNFCIDTDAYKVTHHAILKKNLRGNFAYGESRKGSVFPETIFMGGQIICIDHLEGVVIDKLKIEEAEDASGAYFGTRRYFNRAMWDYILNKYGGMLPLRITAVKEGTKVPVNNILFAIEATDEKCVPLVQHTETLFMNVWYGTTVSTNSYYTKLLIMNHLMKSGTPEMIEYMCHDFGYRATSCNQQAAIGGAAHMVHFRGSDTNIGDRALKFYYGTKLDSVLKSVMASEHAVALMYGPGEGEYEYVHACLDASDPDKIISIVIDTYDGINFIDKVVTRDDIREKILARPGKTVFRQDSGDASETTLRNLQSLANSFGFSYNSKHYKVLHPKIGLLQGDGMKRVTIDALYTDIETNKWSADNLVVGSGSGTLIKDFERDTQRFAIKPSQMIIGDETINVCKMVATQPDKKSKTGRLKLHQSGGKFQTISSADNSEGVFAGYIDSLETIFENGELQRRQTFDEIREIANKHFQEDLNSQVWVDNKLMCSTK